MSPQSIKRGGTVLEILSSSKTQDEKMLRVVKSEWWIVDGEWRVPVPSFEYLVLS